MAGKDLSSAVAVAVGSMPKWRPALDNRRSVNTGVRLGEA